MPDQRDVRDHDIASQPLYTRPMPGGGYVRVELLVSAPANLSSKPLRGRVVMDRRAPVRAGSADHVVVEEINGDDPNVVVAELFRIARDNAAIARRVLRHQAIGRADSGAGPASAAGCSQGHFDLASLAGSVQ